MKVCKFGGTSLASGAQIKKVFDIVMADSERKIIVISAPGKRNKDDIKVTDLLIKCANAYLADRDADSEIREVSGRFSEIERELGISEGFGAFVSKTLKELMGYNFKNPSMLVDAVKAMGEDFNARLTAKYFRSMGAEAEYLSPRDAGMLLSGDFGNAQVLPETYENLGRLRDSEKIIIFPGFYGYTPGGTVATFPRGGSDITGSILAAAVKADIYENFTDVDSVFAANPNIIENPKAIAEFTYREMRELSYMGFSVLHEETLIPVFKAGIPVNIKNTNNPSAPGTLILPHRDVSVNKVAGIANAGNFSVVHVTKYMMNREIGFGRKLLQILEEENISYDHSPSGIDSISVVFKKTQTPQATIEKVVSRINAELEVDNVEVRNDFSLITLVGEGMKSTVGLAARATRALSEINVNIEMLSQGDDEISMLFGVESVSETEAVKALYAAFFGGNS